jgi:hypothetical protein
MRGREGGGGSACSGCGRSEGQSEAMVVLMCLSARKTYIREVQGHYGPVAGLGLLFPFNIFLFFFLSPCCYASIFFNGMPSSCLLLSRLGVAYAIGWGEVLCLALLL